MEINVNALEGLEIAGDSISLPDQTFESLADCLFEVLVEKEAFSDNVLKKLSGDTASLKQAYYGLSTLALEACRKNAEESTINLLLEECKWTPDRISVFNNLMQVHKSDIQVILSRLDSPYPHIVDVDLRLDYCIKSNQLEKLNQSKYLISLKTQEPGKDDGSLEFSCSVEQLQDLVSKLKDATKYLEKASQN